VRGERDGFPVDAAATDAAWWRAVNRDDLWAQVIRDVQEALRTLTGADVVTLWAELPPSGRWLRVAGQLREEVVLSPGVLPHSAVVSARTPLRFATRDLDPEFRPLVEAAGVVGGWFVPLLSPRSQAGEEQWVGAMGLGWRHAPPAEPPLPSAFASALWHLLGQRVEHVYVEWVLESAAALGLPRTTADWRSRFAAMAARLGGDHWALYRIDEAPRPVLGLVAEAGAMPQRGAHLERYIRDHPADLPPSALVQAMRQRRNVFIEDTATTPYRLPPEFADDPVRSSLVVPLGTAGDGGFGVLSVYWLVTAGWRRFGLSMRPWDAFRRVASEWWLGMHAAHDAAYDALTGVLNRNGLGQAWRALRTDAPDGVVAMVDVDHFADVNNRWGHLMGDEVLRALARILAEGAAAVGGVVARWGGDEFVLCLPGAVDVGQLGRQAQATLDALAQRERWPQRVTLSGGAARWRGPDADWQAVLAEADRSLYRAKREGRRRFVAL
jgi:diguanylate cyclase (GGDEF)-like protein